MENKAVNKLLAIFLTLLLACNPLLSNTVFAETVEAEAETAEAEPEKLGKRIDNNLNADCIFAYHSFLFTETYIPLQGGRAIYDAFNLNQCQAMDMILIYDELNDTREQMRSQAISCQPYNELKLEYQKLKLEQIFVREVWPYNLRAWTKEQLDTEEAMIPARLEILRASMAERFVGESEGVIKITVTKEVFNTWFDAWVLKYQDSIPKYIRCKKDAWAEVTQIKNNLSYKFGEIIIAYWEFKQSLEIRQNVTAYYKNLALFKKQEEGEERFKFFGFVKKKGALKNALKEAWLDPKNSLEDTYRAYFEENPISQALGVANLSSGLSFDQALEALYNDDDRLRLETEHLNRKAKYTLRYGNNGDAITVKNSQELYDMTKNLQTSKTSILEMLKTGEKVYERQCR